ncbi:Sec-independent periplasmic protein translocase [Halorubrum distributum JCM 9100]|uniref:Sec-independent periplasmic protein translocase n=3 Tax=Halorubrum distributum TaxID=29283 RepID=M0EBC9_9EURY|nr:MULTISPECIES: twin-arginine translocase subunit TatC [Halorubrum distributum group]ELZ45055.1 Sec-independent periplasmic protein translocase [Halorubrum distributum JCM 9100]ELZ51333.1 Sec-independent periplasmic protein translocase [Halorubrum distributum JCM 10118]MYL67490.1 preprotein translocase subunit TatC [Halorubrum terrestre]
MASALDEDTQRSIAEGQETAKAFLRSIQKDLQKVFVVFLIGFLATFWALRTYIWDRLREVTESNMSAAVAEEADIIATTPFEVILLQAKIGLIVGAIVAIPPLIYVTRDELRARGMWPKSPIARWKLALLGLLGAGLFSAGVAYGVLAFFPLMFGFLAEFGLEADIQPTYGIVMWTEFIVFLSLSFGLAGQMPMVITGLSYAEIVPYETFRDKWRYAVVAIFVFGAVFSPPDPFTQLLWAFPLVALYGFSLYLAKLVVTAKRSSDRIDVLGAVRNHWNVVGGATVLGGAVVYGFYEYGGRTAFNDLLRLAGSTRRFLAPGEGLGLDPATALGIYAALWALAFAAVATLWAVYTDLDTASAGYQYGDPTAIDVGELDAAGVRAAPADAFAQMEEEESLALAQAAIDDDDPEKAQAILDRFDEVNEGSDGEGGDADGDTSDAGSAGGDGDAGGDGLVGSVQNRTSRASSTFLAELTDGEEEAAEDDIGGYYTDLKFIFDSLRTRSFRIVAVFGAVMAAAFTWLYLGGLGTVRGDLERRVPAEIEGGINIITLHPVEALIFMVKFSVMLGIFAAFPVALYYAWPALRERGFVAGRLYQVYLWAGALGAGMIGGFALGYTTIAPGLIGWLVTDARLADMVITYQVSDFLWLVIYTTIGIGFLADIPIAMVLLNNAGVPYRVFRARWREVTIGILLVAAVFTPADVITMFLATIPLMLAYGVGIGVLFLVTFGGRRDLSPPAEFVGE